MDEYGFLFDDFCNCVFGMISYDEENNNEVKIINKSELISWLVEKSESGKNNSADIFG